VSKIAGFGRLIDLHDPVCEAPQISIGDLAAVLSKICRFGGRSTVFYSVAQHSVHVSRLCPPRLALPGLLHDASEALLGDVPTPLKYLLPEYRALEKRWEAALWSQWGWGPEMPPEIKVADRIALATERRDFMRPTREPWEIDDGIGVTPDPIRLVAFSPIRAERLFLARYAGLA